MFSEYKKQVLKVYEKQKIDNNLSLNLQRPTPAKIKSECLNVIAERYSPKEDEQILQTFFGAQNGAKEYLSSIKKFDIDKFRPLLNFLKGFTNHTEDKNIELLAFLLNFKPRPHLFDYDYQNIRIEENQDLESEIVPKGKILENQPSIKQSEKSEVKKQGVIIGFKNYPSTKKRKYLLTFIAVICLISIMATILSKRKSINALLIASQTNQNCMYWTKDHFKMIDCERNNLNVQTIAYDEIKFNDQKKITRIDTLTDACIGKIWYSKIDNNIEFFTAAGMHPEHIENSLKLITKHIYEKYIKKKDSLKSVNSLNSSKQ
ncbi:MAG: hypothetical protein H7098_05665 [Oligoflexus sp.]|nr:hypothetical protein [Pseudopedobacter sp.]